ncbi:MAG: hypothetical protein KJN64_08040 [Ignavibacteria bacterium]|nr:hypothetical protein [Ignavibacteria bacterium]NNJ52878.1 hypothetical protein [Ignavibacteriaceae bacterium]NNL20608.1 hypothetical protein [Ignavibacteriaceae bacterium]
MIKKSFIGFMVLAILNLIGCYSFQSVSPESFNESISMDGSASIELVTKDYFEYRFDRFSYKVKNDTITGNGYVLQLNDEVPFTGKIAFEDIINLNVEKLDGVASFGLAFGVAIIGLILVFVIEFNKNIN